MRNFVVEQADFIVEHLGRCAPDEPQTENPERPRFIGDKIYQAAVLPPEFLGRLAYLSAQNHLAFVKFLGQRDSVSSSVKASSTIISARARNSARHRARADSMSSTSSPSPRLSPGSRGSSTPDDRHPKPAALEDAVGFKNRFAVGLVPQVGAEHRNG